VKGVIPQELQRFVQSDSIQPGRQSGGALKLLDGTKGLQVSRVHQVEGVVPVSSHSEEKVIDALRCAPVELLLRFGIAAFAALDEVIF
jgi:hypothetical protein